MTLKMRYMRLPTCMALFQRWREVTGRKTHEYDEPTVDDVERDLIERRIEQMRPAHTWAEVADSLGMAENTLWKRRKKYGLPMGPRNE